MYSSGIYSKRLVPMDLLGFNRTKTRKKVATTLFEPKKKASWLPALISICIPGANKITIAVLALPTVVGVLKVAFSQGLDRSRVSRLDEDILCYMNHPLASHTHTTSLNHFPEGRQVKIANDTTGKEDRWIAFASKKAAREYFYHTFNWEIKACEREFCRLFLQDALMEAWFMFQFDNNDSSALSIMHKALIRVEQVASFNSKDLSREFMGLRAILCGRLGYKEHSDQEIAKLLKIEPDPIPCQKYPDSGYVFNHLGLVGEPSQKTGAELEGIDILQLWSKEFLEQLDSYDVAASTYSSELQKKYLSEKPGNVYAVALIEAITKNLILMNQYKMWKEDFTLEFTSVDLQLPKLLRPNFIKKFYQACLKDSHPFPKETARLQYIVNSISAFVNAELLKKAQSPAELDSIIEKLSPASPKIEEVLWFEQGNLDHREKRVIFIDTSSKNIKEAKENATLYQKKMPKHKMSILFCPLKRIHELSSFSEETSRCISKASEMLKESIHELLGTYQKEKLLLVCHQSGLEIIQSSLGQMDEENKDKVEVAAISPNAFSSELKKRITYYLSPIDHVSKLVVACSKSQQFKEGIEELEMDIWDRISKINPSNIKHPIYAKLIVSKINNFMS